MGVRLAVHLAGVRDTGVDADDVGVLHFGQELALGDGGLGEVGVGAVDQPLEHDVAIQGNVLCEVYPAHTTKGETTAHLVLACYHVAVRELGPEVVRRTADVAEAFLARNDLAGATALRATLTRGAGIFVRVTALHALLPGERRVTRGAVRPGARAEALVLRHLRLGHEIRQRIDLGDVGNVDETQSKPTAGAQSRRLRRTS